MVSIGARLFDEVRDRWAADIGTRRLEQFEAHLARVAEAHRKGTDDLTLLDDDPLESQDLG
jgi:hypothetical protein